MTVRSFALAGLALPLVALAQFNNPLAIPPLLEEDTFHLTVDEHVHQFYPGLSTPTYGINGEYLGPTLVFHKGDTVRIHLQNDLDTVTSMHWHGLQVPGEADGGPPREVHSGQSWDLKYKVKNAASTYWYHPHPHELTAEQANQGLAGMIIVRDDEEAALPLPRTYGVDDIPLVVQDRRFLANGSFVFGPFGDSVLVNGTPRPYVDLPAQVVRLRLLNGSNSRIYMFGFDDDRQFAVIGSDGGLLSAPVLQNRIRISNGERAEILLDLTGMEGDSLMLKSYGTELTSSMPGSSYVLWESSALNGIDFPVLRIRVHQPTIDPITSVPGSLVNLDPPDLAAVSRTRQKTFSGTGMVGMGMFYINSLMFDPNVVNDTVLLGATEMWTVLNASDIAHPFHVHGGSFYIVDRDGVPPPAWEQGPKDMVLVDMAQQVRIIMKFDELSNGWPFMYHCHNLMHEDNMMMLQYIVIDPNTAVTATSVDGGLTVRPSPTDGPLSFASDFPVDEALLVDMLGRPVWHSTMHGASQGAVDLSALASGNYVLQVRNAERTSRTVVVRK